MSEFGPILEQEIPQLRRYARALTRDSVQVDDLVHSTPCAPSLKGISGSPARVLMKKRTAIRVSLAVALSIMLAPALSR